MRRFPLFLVLWILAFVDPLVARAEGPLEKAIGASIPSVAEFRYIREAAEKLGVRVWLFGGTAAGFGHYVKWDAKRKGGDARYQPDRFDYDYSNIYRSTQDLDIVVDGSPKQVEELQTLLESKFPHLQGSKTAWEVRPLRQKMKDKEALLNNPDFLDQHTDSNSTGMIELTKPPAGESVVRDLRDWNAPNPNFLRDLNTDRLHFYHSPTHFKTSRAKDGLNPPILSVLRYLTKAFQYDLEVDPASFAHIKKIIDEFDPKKDLTTDYARRAVEKNAKKMIQHAVDLEYARESLEGIGLRDKLIALSDPKKEDSMAWWLNKEPLRSAPLGTEGKTAAEVAAEQNWPRGPRGELVVSHETNNFLAYESITRAHTGEPNVFISRKGAANEAAAHGDGFYVRAGREGGRGTGLTIRFELDKDARLGQDFTFTGDYLVVKNKKALRVIPESLNLDPVAYFRFLANAEKIDASDRALMEKLGRRTRAKFATLSPGELATIRGVVEEEIAEYWMKNTALFQEWFRVPASAQHSDSILRMLSGRPEQRLVALRLMRELPHWQDHPFVKNLSLSDLLRGIAATPFNHELLPFYQELVNRFKDLEKLDPADVQKAKAVALLEAQKPGRPSHTLRLWMGLPWALDPSVSAVPKAMVKSPEQLEYLVTEVVRRGDLNYLKANPEVVSGNHGYVVGNAVRDAGEHASFEMLEYLADTAGDPGGDSRIAEKLIREKHAGHPRWVPLVEKLLGRRQADREIARQLGGVKGATQHSEWIEKLIKQRSADAELVSWVLGRPKDWKVKPEWMTTLLARTRNFTGFDIDDHFAQALDQPEWRVFPQAREWLDTLLKKENPTHGLFQTNLLTPQDVDALIAKKRKFIDGPMVEFLMKRLDSPSSEHPSFRDRAWVRERLARIVQNGSERGDHAIVKLISSRPEWRNETGWIDEIVKRGQVDYAVAEKILSQPYSASHPQWLLEILSRTSDRDELAEIDGALNDSALDKAHWKNHPKLLELSGGRPLRAGELRLRVGKAGDTGPLFSHALELSKKHKGPNPWRALDSFSSEDLKALALEDLSKREFDDEGMVSVRRLAQSALQQRNDPRLAEWLKDDLGRVDNRLDFLSALNLESDLTSRVLLDFWADLQPVTDRAKQTLRNYLILDLSRATGKLSPNLLPIALAAVQTAGKEQHSLRYSAMLMLEKMELKPSDALRTAMLKSLKDESPYIKQMAVEQLEALGENSLAYRQAIQEMKAKETYYSLKGVLAAAAERLAKLPAPTAPDLACDARFAGLGT